LGYLCGGHAPSGYISIFHRILIALRCQTEQMPKRIINRNNPCVLIEGATWGDAAFYGKWLLAAGQAETEAWARQDRLRAIDQFRDGSSVSDVQSFQMRD
jgi:hypothetical protein